MITKEDYNKCLKEFCEKIELSELKDNIKSIIVRGSVSKGTVNPPFSDIDLLIVFDNINFIVEKKLFNIKQELENKYGIRVGCNIMSYDECPKILGKLFIQYDKNLTLFLEIDKKRGFYKLIYGEDIFEGIPIKNLEEYIKEDCIRNILFFIGEKRKNITDSTRESLQRNIKLAFNIVKTSLKYYDEVPLTYNDTIEMAEKRFTDFNFNILEKLNELINQWGDENNLDLEEYSNIISQFMEDFKKYFFNRIKIREVVWYK